MLLRLLILICVTSWGFLLTSSPDALLCLCIQLCIVWWWPALLTARSSASHHQIWILETYTRTSVSIVLSILRGGGRSGGCTSQRGGGQGIIGSCCHWILGAGLERGYSNLVICSWTWMLLLRDSRRRLLQVLLLHHRLLYLPLLHWADLLCLAHLILDLILCSCCSVNTCILRCLATLIICHLGMWFWVFILNNWLRWVVELLILHVLEIFQDIYKERFLMLHICLVGVAYEVDIETFAKGLAGLFVISIILLIKFVKVLSWDFWRDLRYVWSTLFADVYPVNAIKESMLLNFFCSIATQAAICISH